MDLSRAGSGSLSIGARTRRELRRLRRRASQITAEQGPAGILAGALRWLQRMLPRTAGSRHLVWRLLRLRIGRETALTVAFLDMDQLTQVDRLQGRAAADRLLRVMVARVKHVLGPRDRVFRYGGDEYVCLFPGIGTQAATGLLEQARREFAADTGARFSFGIVEATPADSAFTLMKRAELTLFAGRARERAGKPA
ncbi:MAG TPA: diguanylate cyclase [Candidatus Dormibacteraeota bacterium]